MSRTFIYIEFPKKIDVSKSKEMSNALMEFMKCYCGFGFTLIRKGEDLKIFTDKIKEYINIKEFRRVTNQCDTMIFKTNMNIDAFVKSEYAEDPNSTFLIVTLDNNCPNTKIKIEGKDIEVRYLDNKNIYKWLVCNEDYENSLDDELSKNLDFKKINIRPLREYHINDGKHGENGSLKTYSDSKKSPLGCTEEEARKLLRYAIGTFKNLLVWDPQEKKFMAFRTEYPDESKEPILYHSYHIQDLDNRNVNNANKIFRIVRVLALLGQAPTKFKNFK